MKKCLITDKTNALYLTNVIIFSVSWMISSLSKYTSCRFILVGVHFKCQQFTTRTFEYSTVVIAKSSCFYAPVASHWAWNLGRNIGPVLFSSGWPWERDKRNSPTSVKTRCVWLGQHICMLLNVRRSMSAWNPPRSCGRGAVLTGHCPPPPRTCRLQLTPPMVCVSVARHPSICRTRLIANS